MMEFIFYQTEDGMYDSCPDVKHIREEMNGEFDPRYYDNRGHGEYVRNVERAAEFCLDNNINPEDLEFISSLDV